MSYFRYVLIIIFSFTFLNAKAEISDFEKGKNLFENRKYDLAKFKFEKDIVYNPKNESSYLYLAKIFKFKKDDNQEEKNLNTVILLNPKNEEAILNLASLKIRKSNYTETRSLIKDLKKICKALCLETSNLEKKLDILLKKQMSTENFLNQKDKIVIIDFGSQVTKLIARRIRELKVYCEIVNLKNFKKIKNFYNIKGIILSGGPSTVTQKVYPSISRSIFKKNERVR